MNCHGISGHVEQVERFNQLLFANVNHPIPRNILRILSQDRPRFGDISRDWIENKMAAYLHRQIDHWTKDW